jgi:hypothetical protein
LVRGVSRYPCDAPRKAPGSRPVPEVSRRGPYVVAGSPSTVTGSGALTLARSGSGTTGSGVVPSRATVGLSEAFDERTLGPFDERIASLRGSLRVEPALRSVIVASPDAPTAAQPAATLAAQAEAAPVAPPA